MCRRYTIRRPGLLAKLVYQDEFEEFSEIRLTSLPPNFGIRPSTPVPIVRLNQAKRRVFGEAMRG